MTRPVARLARILVAALLPLTAATAQVTFYSASLDAAQEVPPTSSTARGWGIVRLDGANNGVRVVVRRDPTSDIVAAHLHLGGVGINGAILVNLTANGTEWTGTGTLSAADATALRNGGTYLSVHSNRFPGGDIRGQVVTPVATRFTAVLDGAQQLPPNSSAGRGVAVAFLYEPENRLVYSLQTSGLTNVTSGHLVFGAPGVRGATIHDLTGAAPDYCGVTQRLTSAEVAAIKGDGLHFNIVTGAFTAGEIRGQIERNFGDLRAVLDGAQVVPPVTTAAIGSFSMRVNPDRTVTYRLLAGALTGTSATIARGAVGNNGPTVLTLNGGPNLWSGTTAPLSATELADARNDNWYVSIATAANPNGEIRGQVNAARLPTTFGGACANNDGRLSQIGADAAPVLGGSFRVTVSGAPSGAPALFTLGGSREQSGALPLPFELSPVGGNDCYMFAAFNLDTFVVCNAAGCAALPLALPLSPSLRNSSLYLQWFLIDVGLRTRSSNALELSLQ